MKDGTRVPRTIVKFDQYISDTDKRLQSINPATFNPYWKDYGLTSGRDNLNLVNPKISSIVFRHYMNSK